jgi:hypothetical protein
MSVFSRGVAAPASQPGRPERPLDQGCKVAAEVEERPEGDAANALDVALATIWDRRRPVGPRRDREQPCGGRLQHPSDGGADDPPEKRRRRRRGESGGLQTAKEGKSGPKINRMCPRLGSIRLTNLIIRGIGAVAVHAARFDRARGQ